MISRVQMLRHTFRAVWPLPAEPPPKETQPTVPSVVALTSPAEAKLIESLDRFDRVLDERRERHHVFSLADAIDALARDRGE